MVRQSPRKAQQVSVVQATTEVRVNGTTNGTTHKVHKAVTVTKVVEERAEQKMNGANGVSSRNKRKSTTTQAEEEEHASCAETSEAESDEAPPKKKAKRASKAKVKAAVNMVLAQRTAVSSLKKALYIGAHISSAGGVQNSIQNALNIGSNAFALFLKSQRKWDNPPLSAETATEFAAAAATHEYDVARHCVPHGSYLVNLAQPEAARAAQAYASLVDDLSRCAALGIGLYNLHPGSTLGADRADALRRIAGQLNRAHADERTGGVVTLLENMAGAGNVVGSRFEDLAGIIALVEDKARVGVCIDTCHAFAAGYDLRTPEAFEKTMEEFDEVVGSKYLRAFHLNDSKAPFASNRDVHANIGTGFLGLRAFHSLVNHAPLQSLPMVLETPIEKKGADGKTLEDRQVWADEIKLLESLVDMDPESDEFKRLETELQSRGAEERKKFQEQADRKAEKAAKKTAGKGKRGKKQETTSDEDSD